MSLSSGPYPVRVRLFRFTHPDGAQKDWAVPVEIPADRLPVWYGVTGSVLRSTQTLRVHCRQGNPVWEADRRCREKLAKGYQGLGEWWLAVDGRTLRPVQPTPAPVASPPAPVALDRLLADLRSTGEGGYF